MTRKEIGLAVAAVASLAVVMVGGNALARGGGSTGQLTAATSSAAPAPRERADHGWPGHHHTPVTGAELSKVTAAVKAKDAAVTVRMVQQDADGSYDVVGTKQGSPVALEVSKDLTTVTERSGRGGFGGPGGRHDGERGTAVTGAELRKVTAAVKAEDAAVTVRGVRQDPGGGYHVLGTKKGAPVLLEVSKDLKTVTEHTGALRGPGGFGGHGWGRGSAVTGAELRKVRAAVAAKDSAVTVRGAVQDPDEGYHVFGTKKGAPVVVEVSKDLKTVTVHSGRPGHAGHRPDGSERRWGPAPSGGATPSTSSSTNPESSA